MYFWLLLSRHSLLAHHFVIYQYFVLLFVPTHKTLMDTCCVRFDFSSNL
uniref:Uncharacterized protein n=1 Tax=Myoviridae sp. ctqfO1 TaxID=2827710 RepID=A0A8S5T3Z4_9CAUD|nr:MAG TPA: hypothetical protein [Myoviridae sp. ctqfO1]